MMRSLIRYLATVLYKPLLEKYLSRERSYVYGDLRLQVHPEVFHPGFFFSTKILLRGLSRMDLGDKRLLELGAGSGLISIAAAKAGAVVTATDINPVAIRYLGENGLRNRVSLTLIESDLFQRIPAGVYDVILINPPYYFHTPTNFKEHAWYCGSNGEYFQSLFAGLSNYTHNNTVIQMILCEGSDRQRIGAIAAQYGFGLDCIYKTANLVERNYVYVIRKAPVMELPDAHYHYE